MHHKWAKSIYSFLLLAILLSCFLSCKIEDEHGTLKFMLGLEGHTSQHGELISNFNVEGEFYVNQQTSEIYFVGCNSEEHWCENLSLFFLNYETGTSGELLSIDPGNTNAYVISNQPFTDYLIIIEERYSTGKSNMYLANTKTHELQEIVSTSDFGIWVTAGNDFIFYNKEYDSYSITKLGLNGNSEELPIHGFVIYAFPESTKIVVQDPYSSDYMIYDYQLDKIIKQKSIVTYPNKFYSFEDELYYLGEHHYRSIINFNSGEQLFRHFDMEFLLDFNPVCQRAVFMRSEPLGALNSQYQLHHNLLFIEDFESNISQTGIDLFEEYIMHAKILDDGNTIIYNAEGTFYITTID